MDKLVLKQNYNATSLLQKTYASNPIQLVDDFLYTLTDDSTLLKLEYSQLTKSKDQFEISESITSFFIDSSNNQALICVKPNVVKTFNLETKELLNNLKTGSGPIAKMECDFEYAVFLTPTGNVHVMERSKTKIVFSYKSEMEIGNMIKILRNNDKTLNLCCGDILGNLVFISINKKNINKIKSNKIKVHEQCITQLITIEKNTIVTCARDSMIKICEINSKKAELKLINKKNIGMAIECMEIVNLDEKKYIVCGCEKGYLVALDMDLTIVSQTQVFDQYTVVDLKYHSKSQTLVIGSYNDYLSTYTISKENGQLHFVNHKPGFINEVTDVAFMTNNNDLYAAVASSDDYLKIVNTKSLEISTFMGHLDTLMCVDSVKNLILTGSKDQSAILWLFEANSNNMLKLLSKTLCEGHTSIVSAVKIMDSNRFLTASNDKTVKVWKYNIEHASSNPEVECMYTVNPHTKDINSLDVSSNSKLFATASQDKTAKIFSMKNGELLGELKGHKKGIWCIKFSNYEPAIATCSSDKTIKIWSLKDYTCLRTLEGHNYPVLQMSYISRGNQLLSCGDDGLVKLWNTRNGEATNTFDNHDQKIWTMKTINEGETVLTGDADGVLKLWSDITQQEIEEKAKEEQTKLDNEHKLEVFINRKEYKKAFEGSLELNHPFQLLKILKTVFEESVSTNSVQEISVSIKELKEELLARLFEYIRDWNTNTKNYLVAHRTIQLILNNTNLDKLKNIKNMEMIIDAINAYSQKHFQRIDNTIIDSCLIDQTYYFMNKTV